MPPASADACQRIDPSNLDANEDSGATAVAIVAPDAVSRVWSPALDEFIASSCALGNDSPAETAGIGQGLAVVDACRQFVYCTGVHFLTWP